MSTSTKMAAEATINNNKQFFIIVLFFGWVCCGGSSCFETVSLYIVLVSLHILELDM